MSIQVNAYLIVDNFLFVMVYLMVVLRELPLVMASQEDTFFIFYFIIW